MAREARFFGFHGGPRWRSWRFSAWRDGLSHGRAFKTKGGPRATVVQPTTAKASNGQGIGGGKVSKTPQEAAAAQDFRHVLRRHDNDLRE